MKCVENMRICLKGSATEVFESRQYLVDFGTKYGVDVITSHFKESGFCVKQKKGKKTDQTNKQTNKQTKNKTTTLHERVAGEGFLHSSSCTLNE